MLPQFNSTGSDPVPSVLMPMVLSSVDRLALTEFHRCWCSEDGYCEFVVTVGFFLVLSFSAAYPPDPGSVI